MTPSHECRPVDTAECHCCHHCQTCHECGGCWHTGHQRVCVTQGELPPKNPVAHAPGGGCFGWPIQNPGGKVRYCNQPAVATIVMLDERNHPDWRACTAHAKDCDEDNYSEIVRVDWDGEIRCAN